MNRRGGGVPVALGEPVSLEGDGGVLLSRQAGRNLLVVCRDEPTTRSLVAAALVSLEVAPEEIDLRLVAVGRPTRTAHTSSTSSPICSERASTGESR